MSLSKSKNSLLFTVTLFLVKYCTFKKGKLMTGTKKSFVLMHSIFVLNIKYLYLNF